LPCTANALMDRVIDISSAEEDEPQELSRHDILAPFIQSSVSALGGIQITPSGRVYEMGDSCLGCLKDLKKFWRKDDTDDERTVARIFWETRVLANDLVNILLETAGKGAVEDKRAIACGVFI
jgi:replication fork protection complex subunit Tof1/Swi1